VTCRWCIDDAFALLVDFGFTPEQAAALIASRETVFLVPVRAA
jgi:hypothetical protein